MSNKIKKIIITSHALRGAWYNIVWLHELFCYFIETATGLKCYCTISPKQKKFFSDERFIPYDIKKIYNAYGIKYEYEQTASTIAEGWANLFYNNEYNEEAYNYINSIFKDSLIISYEIEDIMANMFSYLNIPFIDINLDPIRFLPDIMLCFKTKIKDVYEKILKYKINEELIYMHASSIKARYLEIETFGNDVLFLGQTALDKTLIDQKTRKIYSILNHKKEFEESLSGYENIIFKPHPYASDSHNNSIIEYLKNLNNVKITYENFYKLCSSRNIQKVVSISSGTCSEAKYFGKEIQTLLREGVPRQTKNEFDENKYISVYGDFFSLNFWSDILSPIIKTKKYDKLISIAGENRLRDSRANLEFYYSYKNPYRELVENKIRRTIMMYNLCNDEVL